MEFFVLVNGRFRAFLSSRGVFVRVVIISFFVLCMGTLFRTFLAAQASSSLLGFKCAPKAPRVSHLFFVSDTVIFLKAYVLARCLVKSILTRFFYILSHCINFSICNVAFAPSVSSGLQYELLDLFYKFLQGNCIVCIWGFQLTLTDDVCLLCFSFQ